VWAVIIVVLGALLFHNASFQRVAETDSSVKTHTPKAERPYSISPNSKMSLSALYSVDVFLPFADLQQKKIWQLDAQSSTFDICEIWYLFEELAGWILTALVAASATGLLKR
jgi:hypothetical protein